MGDLLDTGKLVQKSCQNKMDIDKILEIIQRKVLKGTHLPIMVKEIQAGYLISPYFKDFASIFGSEYLPSKKSANSKVEALAEKYILPRLFVIQVSHYVRQREDTFGHTRNMHRQDYYPLPF